MDIFDLIGPIMVGPSSSHTAGAVRIGLVARRLLGEEPARAELLLHGSFADPGRGHGTDRALIAGLLGMEPDKTFAQGLKAGLGDAFTVFLNTISAFGNIMSYIRLFAVGMASLAIAQSFNNMAFGFKGPLVIAAILILLIGHGINLFMSTIPSFVHHGNEGNRMGRYVLRLARQV